MIENPQIIQIIHAGYGVIFSYNFLVKFKLFRDCNNLIHFYYLTMLIIGCLLAVLVGLTLGLVGSGGTILTVPILVYIMGVDPVMATTYSLFAIGVCSLTGGIRGIIKKEADLPKVLSFGVPSLVTVFITRSFILPLVPEIIHIAGYAIDQRVALMILFSFIMVASSFSMIRAKNQEINGGNNNFHVPVEIILLQGATVGLITGLVGAGGGFLIIPTLMNFYHLPIRRAVATSLIIIFINSFFGILGDLEKIPDFQWPLLISYTMAVLLGISIGFYYAGKIPNKLLKITFGYLILAIGLFIFIREIIHI